MSVYCGVTLFLHLVKLCSKSIPLLEVGYSAFKLQRFREESFMSNILSKVDACVTDNLLEPLQRSKPNRTSANLSETLVPESLPLQENVEWKRQFFQALNLIESELDRRFDQPGMKEAAGREDILVNSAHRKFSSKDISKVQLPSDIEKSRFTMELTLFDDLTKKNDAFPSVPKATEFVLTLNSQTRSLFRELQIFIELCLYVLVSAASLERSFSALKSLKTWLRNTTQKRLRHLNLMHVHLTILHRIDIRALVQKFISITTDRKAAFGVS